MAKTAICYNSDALIIPRAVRIPSSRGIRSFIVQLDLDYYSSWPIGRHRNCVWGRYTYTYTKYYQLKECQVENLKRTTHGHVKMLYANVNKIIASLA